jgi:hypothetical protein
MQRKPELRGPSSPCLKLRPGAGPFPLGAAAGIRVRSDPLAQDTFFNPHDHRGRHTLVRVWDGQQLRQYVDGLRTDTVAVTATGSWSIYKWGWQFFSS